MSKLAAALLTSAAHSAPTKTPTESLRQPPDQSSEPDELVPDPKVCREFNVSAMTLWRWDRDPQLAQLGWPAPIEIRRRKFRSRKQLEAFKARMLRNALPRRRAQAASGRKTPRANLTGTTQRSN